MQQDEQPLVLIVDDDEIFRHVLSRAMTKRGYLVQEASNVEEAWSLASDNPPEYAVVDLKMPGDSGLVLVQKLKQLDPATSIVILTGYASIATAVEAVKLGATYYLAKPANADDILNAFQKTQGNPLTPVSESPLSVDRLEWEHIQRVLQEHQGNISATARSLNMHRRTLQRKLSKHPTKQ